MSEQVEITILRLTTRYDERYSNLYIRLEQGENLQMLSDKKISTICIKVLENIAIRKFCCNGFHFLKLYRCCACSMAARRKYVIGRFKSLAKLQIFITSSKTVKQSQEVEMAQKAETTS